jgi:hypothetical protein
LLPSSSSPSDEQVEITEFEDDEESFLVEAPPPEAPDIPEGLPLSSPLL